ncbi:MAG: glycosyltransferase [Nitrososphaeraceae archaeon]
MKVLLQSRINLFNVPGGDTIQVLKTKEYLMRLGVDANISTELEPDVSGYDIVHLFNLIRPQEIYLQARNAKKMGKKVVLSPVYVDYTEYDKKGRYGFARLIFKNLSTGQIEYLKVLARAIKNKELHKGTFTLLLNGYLKLQNKILYLTDMLLPNSNSEIERIERNFDLKSMNYIIVPNAVDVSKFDFEKTNVDKEIKKFSGCVLCVARIEGRKSQLNLVKAVRGLPLKLILIGKPAPNHLKYYQKVKKEADKNVIILDYISHEKLSQYYKVAKVHALPSWFETTGLSSLEAGVMGCNLVVSDKGDTKEYFKEFAYYCEPNSVESIREAVIQAYENPINPKLKEHIMKNFNWEKTADKTLEAYQKVLN